MHHASHRVEDNMLDHLEKGTTRQETAPNSYTEKRRIRGVTSQEYHASKRTGEEHSSHFTNVVIKVILVSICVLCVAGLIAFLAIVVLR